MRSQESPRRKRLVIDPHFQAVFALYAVITTVVMVPVFLAANSYFFSLFASKAEAMGLPQDAELLNFVQRQQTLMIVVFICATILAIVINVIASYIFSNRIAGSMFRLKAALSQAKDFESAKKINPRKFDFFQDVTEAYNQLLDRSGAPR